ncbi:tetratricopeptide repeat protein (macronuclear) [Tetrahymena thermophila SB210]|uniref:Tetratricopeptide repeat protein n=1 Tax=Tetrahymena thermophila (strain SB210) TaxID=312017 RepID=Q24HI4_TETTS|nr:tetratricopeptide repeat protein [Tetrahymena thermophila SB210]EAS07247.4 tetratricopeptide repeat protein [Tetrahymena thermophila SB210]|eukprot:XP_001027489.4 tetratricopeptide repeat protein [Tetrahymena thermophila SB210]
MQVQQDILDIEEVRLLHFNSEYAKCQERCKIILQQKPYLYQVRTYYGFFLMYDDLSESLKQQLQVYQEDPYYFENTSYLLDNIFCNFQNKGRSLVQTIFKQYYDYQGEKNGFYYICLALIYRIQKGNEKSYQILISKLNDYDDQPMVQIWFYHQLGDISQSITDSRDDVKKEDVQKSIFFYEKAIELQPRSQMNITNLGVQYHIIGTQETIIKSIQCFYKALNIIPEDHHTLCNLSSVLQDVGHYDQNFINSTFYTTQTYRLV